MTTSTETNEFWDNLPIEALKDSELFEDLDIIPMILTIVKDIYFSSPHCEVLFPRPQ